MAHYRDQRASALDYQRRLGEVAATATSPRRVVSVTVGGQGQVTDVSFPTGAYKRMAPAELASAILSTIAEARDKALDEAADLLAPMLPPGLDARQVMRGQADIGAVLPPEPPVVGLTEEEL
ncbi:hypothetical protein BJP25_22945 [Actinokineospora bangkokensis]|uniref:YbaB/EbfC family DNA-binding protein n=2 Tax=Actinokineospora bangkokensis TaxID=1193682 RepID=A0A1Q9LJU3_9PSEU|nr:hypothetical protein BJP25_22945 [Actinokineospora bangkokensis]